ncbi:MAG: peptidylprolyl isomerase [candidate division Zixibacteria bacterium]|nr:peptidylprolyl isomerase [candidate division Zixibacteria bacterium]
MHRRFVVFVSGTLMAVLICFGNVLGEPETVDRIAAVVGDEIILASELASEIQMVAFQTGRRPQSEAEVKEFQQEVLDQMISDRLFLMEAKTDTSIQIREEEVQEALDDQIARVAGNFASNEEFLQALSLEGLTLRALERRYQEDIRNNLLRQRFIQKKLYSVSISRYEAEQFFQQYRDSIPAQPEAAQLAHILLKVEPAAVLEDSVKALATDLRKRIIDGADFATISSRYSSHNAGANGGDLGFVAREDVVDEFARAAFKLSEGDISGVIRTQFGYHVIKCEGKRGDRLHLRHLLLEILPSAEDTVRTLALADSLINELNAVTDFAELAKTFSRDDGTRAQGGELGWFAVNQLPPDFVSTVTGWTTPG